MGSALGIKILGIQRATYLSSILAKKLASQGELGNSAEKLLGKKEKEMNAYRLKLIQKEFPFVNMLGFENFKDVDSIEIKRGDKNLLSRMGYEDSYSWSCGGYRNYTNFYAVFFTNRVARIVNLESVGRSRSSSGENREWKANPIGEQLFIAQINPDYIVEIQRDDVDANGNGRLSYRIVIYKMNKFNLVGYHQNQVDITANILKKEISEVCS